MWQISEVEADSRSVVKAPSFAAVGSSAAGGIANLDPGPMSSVTERE